MEMDADGNDEGQINVGVNGGAGANKVPHEVVTKADRGIEADGVPHEVVTGAEERAHKGLYGSDEALAIAQRMFEEKTMEYSTDVEAYRARIPHLESMLAEFGIRSNGSSSIAPLIEVEDVDRAPPMVHVFVQVERNAAIEQTTAANL